MTDAPPAAPPPEPPAAAPARSPPPALQPVRRLPRRSPAAGASAQVPREPRLVPPFEASSPQASEALRRRPFINLCGDYRFLRAGYWALVDAELNGIASSPSPMQAVTAQNAAACLLVARHAGIATVDWKVAKAPQDVEPPCLLVPCSGLTDATYEVKSTRSRAAQWRSATQNGTRTALAVRHVGELRSMRMVVGVTAHEDYQLAWDVWRTFGVPLATIWYMEAPSPSFSPASSSSSSSSSSSVSSSSSSPPSPASSAMPPPSGDASHATPSAHGASPTAGKRLFLGLDPLPLHELTERELRLYEEISQRPLSLGPEADRRDA